MKDRSAVELALERARGLVQARDLDAAARIYAEILALDGACADAWFMQGVVHAERGNLGEARTSIERAFALQPAQSAANRLVFANVALDAGDPALAQAQAEAALAASPAWAPALVTLGVALHRQGRAADALGAQRAALAADPTYARAYSALAGTLTEGGEHGEAIALLTRAIERWPDRAALRAQFAQALWRQGRSMSHAARLFDAIDAYRESLAIDPGHADRWNDLAIACANAGLLAEARQGYLEALRRDPGYHQVESNLLIHLHYDPAVDAQAMFDAHRAWASRHATGLQPPAPPARRALAPGAKLRVGFLSPRLAFGPTGAFLEPLLDHIDARRFEVTCYRVGGAIDEHTRRLRSRAHAWRDLDTADDAAIAERIRADALDVLVDLAGHSPGGRLLVLARKPAPVIATWLDYFDTTGLDTVDFLVGDPVSTPAAGAQRFTETVVRLEPSRLCYAPPADAPPVAPPPAERNGYVTFGTFNRLSKLTPAVFALWSGVLRAVPRSRLLLKSAALVDPRVRERVVGLAREQGIDPEAVELRADSPHGRMLLEYGDIDIALDPFPYNGGLTTCEALWMGVPVLALMGDSMVSRQSAALLAAAGFDHWIAATERAFVELAVREASDLAALARARSGLRERLAASALLDARRFARQFGEALLAMCR